MSLVGSFDEETDRFLQAWMQVRQLVQAANFNRFRRAGLSATQFMTLNVVPEEGLTLADLARKLNLSAASLKKTIDSLVERGLVYRQPRPEDGRKIDILSTPKGKRLQNSASREFRAFVAGLFTAMSPQDRQGLVTGLEKLLEVSSWRNPDERSGKSTLREGAAPRAKRSIGQSHSH